MSRTISPDQLILSKSPTNSFPISSRSLKSRKIFLNLRKIIFVLRHHHESNYEITVINANNMSIIISLTVTMKDRNPVLLSINDKWVE